MYDLIIESRWDELYVHIAVWAAVIFTAWIAVAAACFSDMWSGVSTARALGEKVHSHRLRETIGKIKDYTGVLLAFLFIDILGALFTWYKLPFFQMLIAAGAVLIEGWSVIENKRRKSSHAALIPELAAEIVKCAREKDAEAIVYNIKNIVEKQQKGASNESKQYKRKANGNKRNVKEED